MFEDFAHNTSKSIVAGDVSVIISEQRAHISLFPFFSDDPYGAGLLTKVRHNL